MFAVRKKQRLPLLACFEELVSLVAIVKKRKSCLVEKQRRSEQDHECDIQAFLFHNGKGNNLLNCLHVRS